MKMGKDFEVRSENILVSSCVFCSHHTHLGSNRVVGSDETLGDAKFSRSDGRNVCARTERGGDLLRGGE